MKTLLVLVKNPAASRWYIEYAMYLAKDLRLEVHLLNVENPAYHPLTGPGVSGAAVVQLQQSLEAKASLARDSLTSQVNELVLQNTGQVVVEVTSVIGDEISLIKQMVEEDKVHMVMVATEGSGNSGYKRSFVDEVFRNVQCPLWIIPENSRYQSLKSIVYATDYQEEDIPALKKLIGLIHVISPKITALHITGNPDFESRIKNAGFQRIVQNKTGYDNLTVKAFVEKNGMDVPEMVGELAARDRVNLVAVLKENKHFFERIFTSGTSDKIIHETDFPVLVFHSQGES